MMLQSLLPACQFLVEGVGTAPQPQPGTSSHRSRGPFGSDLVNEHSLRIRNHLKCSSLTELMRAVHGCRAGRTCQGSKRTGDRGNTSARGRDAGAIHRPASHMARRPASAYVYQQNKSAGDVRAALRLSYPRPWTAAPGNWCGHSQSALRRVRTETPLGRNCLHSMYVPQSQTAEE